MTTTKTRLLDAAGLNLKLDGLADAIVAHPRGCDRLALVGIVTRGDFLARRLVARLADRLGGKRVPLGEIDISLYRDDRHASLRKPLVKGTHITFPIDDARIVLIDDVAYTGRTARAAIDQIMDFGRPNSIELAVLVDRGCRELPIAPDYAGLTIQTKYADIVKVRVTEVDGDDEVVLLNGK